MATAFQPGGFQNDAFQIEEVAASTELEDALALIVSLRDQLNKCKAGRTVQYRREAEQDRILRNNQLIMALVGGVCHGNYGNARP